MRLSDALRLSFVPRWTVVPMLRNQTVSDHCWRVAMIVGALAVKLGHDPQRLIRMAVEHDLDEAFTGDTPSTAKVHRDPIEMSGEELIVKMADCIESHTWAQNWCHSSERDSRLGYTGRRYNAVLRELAQRYPNAPLLVREIREEMV